MESLVVILWIVYLSECLGRVQPGDWVFRGEGIDKLAGCGEPDLALAGGRYLFFWLPFLPWRMATRACGREMDVEAARARLDAVRKATELLRVLACALFFVLLPALTLAVFTGRTAPLLVPWVGLTLIAWGGTAWSFFRAYRLIHGRRPPLEVTLSHVLSPVGLTRGACTVYWTAAADFHPLAIAAAACEDEEFLRIARCIHFDEPGVRGWIENALARRRLTHRFPEPPVPDHPSLTRYCPRCHATYRAQASSCADCPSVSLLDLGARLSN